MSFVGQDLRHAVRSLWASRATTSLAILCLSLGIGVNTLVFSLVNGCYSALCPLSIRSGLTPY
jgi:hypothetical protein